MGASLWSMSTENLLVIIERSPATPKNGDMLLEQQEAIKATAASRALRGSKTCAEQTTQNCFDESRRQLPFTMLIALIILRCRHFTSVVPTARTLVDIDVPFVSGSRDSTVT